MPRPQLRLLWHREPRNYISGLLVWKFDYLCYNQQRAFEWYYRRSWRGMFDQYIFRHSVDCFADNGHNRTIVICVMEEVYREEYLVRAAMVRRARLPYSLVRSEFCKGRQVLSECLGEGWLILGRSFCCNFMVIRLYL
jgi:hypothetical protein